MPNTLDESERLLCEMIAQLQEQHAKQLKPLFDRLADIRALRPPPPMLIRADQLPADLAALYADAP